MQKGKFVGKDEVLRNLGDYQLLYQWGYLEWLFEDEAEKKAFYENEYYKGAMPAGFKMDSMGNYYLSVPRWNPGIPATFNKIVEKDGKAYLEPFPSRAMNREGDPDAIQSVLGFEIDENDVLWILDQAHLQDKDSADGAQKIVKYDLRAGKLIDVIKIPNEISSYKASFLNDICVDNEAGYAYIADSGINADPLEGGLIVVNTKTNELRRILHQHVSTQDVEGFWFEINGVKIWRDTPMRTGADGIALSADRKTLYWCPLTSRNLYCIRTSLIQDFSTPEDDIERAVVDCGSKGTNTDGMTADNLGRIWFTMLEHTGMGYYDPKDGTMHEFVSDPRMVWVDTPQIDNRGHILFSTNQLHFLNRGELDYTRGDNLCIWRAFIGNDVKNYLIRNE